MRPLSPDGTTPPELLTPNRTNSLARMDMSQLNVVRNPGQLRGRRTPYAHSSENLMSENAPTCPRCGPHQKKHLGLQPKRTYSGTVVECVCPTDTGRRNFCRRIQRPSNSHVSLGIRCWGEMSESLCWSATDYSLPGAARSFVWEPTNVRL